MLEMGMRRGGFCIGELFQVLATSSIVELREQLIVLEGRMTFPDKSTVDRVRLHDPTFYLDTSGLQGPTKMQC
jgi:hypothetical protein